MPIMIHASNRMEILLDKLAGVLSKPLGKPLSVETVMVQSRGMERWISMELAKKFGVWGNCAYPFPNKFIWDIFVATMPSVTKSDSFESEYLFWRVMNLLPAMLQKPEFSELNHYLAGQSRSLKLYQLAEKIADSFDQYTIYRGDILELWESGKENHWQAILWKTLVDEQRGKHRSSIKNEFIKRLADGAIDVSLLPERVLIFGLSYLPSFHLEVLAALSSYRDVHIFTLSPCREYWGDIRSARSCAISGIDLSPTGDWNNNDLLASLGYLGKNFGNMLLESEALFSEENENYQESDGDTLLSSLQNSILDLKNADPVNRIEIATKDRSITVHSCHSQMREVEVLHDQLLEMFSTMQGLEPRDIIVMTPDIETYSPYISAVFSGIQDSRRRIPFTIADQSIRYEGKVGKALMAILALPGSRFTAPDVMEILEAEPVCRAFGIVPDDIDLIKGWIEETRIRWGMSGKDRADAGLPLYQEGSWMAGLERLLLGYAMPSDNRTLFDGVLPFDSMEGDSAEILGRFVRFVKTLYSAVRTIAAPKSPLQWQESLNSILKEFIRPSDKEARECSSINHIFEHLGTVPEITGFSGDVSLDVIRAWLKRRLDSEAGGTGFLSGKVTFCAMLPMRSIPAKVVAMLGMNDGSFPRQSRSPGFDIIQADPQPGDRSLRNEDRYLFLEAILSARERLYISYTGLSIKDNSVIPPSVLVSELLDFVDRGYSRGEGDFHKSLVTLHRLQPFSPAYFTGMTNCESIKLFSYSQENHNAALGFLAAAEPRAPFFVRHLSPPDELYREVHIANLLKFYQNPSAYILRHRLGIVLKENAEPLKERETFNLDRLEEYGIKNDLLPHLISGKDPSELLPVVRARGMLPPAGLGEKLFDRVVEESAALAANVKSFVGSQQYLPQLDLDLVIGNFRVYGRISNILPDRLLHFSCAKLSAKYKVKLWIEHLLLNYSEMNDYPLKSTLIMSDGNVTLEPVNENGDILKVLLNRYWQGLSEPLCFFPKSSLAFVEKGKISAAESIWLNKFMPELSECNDQSYKLCFGDDYRLDEEFMEVANDIFGKYTDSLEVHK